MLYAVLGVPAARWADRGDRRLIITLAIAVWSVMTALCGAAQSFWQLALVRVGVGVGEAGATPPSQSLLVDYFPPEQRGRALAILTSAATAGYLIAFVGGAAVVAKYGWRWAFVLVGLPGLLIALLTLTVLKEPRAGGAHQQSGASQEPFMQTLRLLWRKSSYRNALLALTLWAFFAYGAVVFVPSHLVRALGVNLNQVGLAYGGVSAISALVGTLGIGTLTDILARRDRRWLFWLPALGLLLAFPLYVAAFLARNFTAFLMLGAIGGAFVSGALPAVFAGTHAVCGSARRAVSVAILLFFMSLLGATAGPLFTGAVSDLLAASSGQSALGHSLAWMSCSMPVVAALLLMAARTLDRDAEP